MYSLDKILIVVIVVLVGFVGVIGIFIFPGIFSNNSTMNLSNNSTLNNSLNITTDTNQTDIDANNSTNNQTDQNYISRSTAIEIARQAAEVPPGDETKFTASLHETYDPPFWHVIAWDKNMERAIGGVYINAITGEVISARG